jgi:hypothetical protein
MEKCQIDLEEETDRAIALGTTDNGILSFLFPIGNCFDIHKTVKLSPDEGQIFRNLFGFGVFELKQFAICHVVDR